MVRTIPTPEHVLVRQLFTGLAAALFDLDNTLVETHIDFVRMKQETLALAAHYGVETQSLVECDILGVVEGAQDALQRAGEPDRAKAFRGAAFALLAEIEIRECAAPVELPGAAETLAALQERKVPVAIVTRNCRAVSERLIAFGRLHCDALLTRDDVPHTKPHPDHLHRALTVLQQGFPGRQISPTACLMVGDSWMDVAAGRAAALRTLGLKRNRPMEAFASAPPELLLNDMAELWRCLQASEEA